MASTPTTPVVPAAKSTASQALLQLIDTPTPDINPSNEVEILSLLSQTPDVEEPAQKPCRLNNSAFVKGLYCDFKSNIDTGDKWYSCRIIDKSVVKQSNIVTVQPCSLYGDGDPLPLALPIKNVRPNDFGITDTVQVLDDRPTIPDKDHDYWYEAEIVDIKYNRRALPSYVVLPVHGDKQVTVSAMKVRPHRYWEKGDYWSTGPLGPTKIEHEILKQSKADTAKATAEQAAQKSKALAKGAGLGDLMQITNRHALLATPTRSKDLNAPTDFIAVEGADGQLVLMNKSLVGKISWHTTPLHPLLVDCSGPLPEGPPDGEAPAPAGEAPAPAPAPAGEAPAPVGEAPAPAPEPAGEATDPADDDEPADYDDEFPYEPYLRIRKDFAEHHIYDVGRIFRLTAGAKCVDRSYLPLVRIRGEIFLKLYLVPSKSHTFTPHIYATNLRHKFTPHIYARNLRHNRNFSTFILDQ